MKAHVFWSKKVLVYNIKQMNAKKILIIEDEKPVLGALVEKFNLEGFEVFEAENGEDGVKSAEANKPDIILLDLIMPVMTGLQALKAIREGSDYGKHVPIVILTNLDPNDKISDEISHHQPSFYIIKADMKIEEVVHKVKELLGM